MTSILELRERARFYGNFVVARYPLAYPPLLAKAIEMHRALSTMALRRIQMEVFREEGGMGDDPAHGLREGT